MNDYKFGNFIYALRQKAGLSQHGLAERLGVTDKAVSKWENGKAKPTTNTIRKLAALFGVSVEDILQMKEDEKNMTITKIVITGGPCAGKSTAMSWIQNAFTEKGYTVLFVPETATELITGGVTPWNCGGNLDYQKCQMRLQIAKESVFEEAARTMSSDKILIVCDRGAMDNKAYMSDLEFVQVLESVQTGEVELRDSYDAVFHLVTAAKGAVEFYTTANNQARTETPEQAAALDDKLIAAWTGHPHLRVIDNTTDFEAKMKRLIGEIAAFLGEPEPLEIERKYLIEYPDLKWLEQAPNCRRVEIIQTYLTAGEGEERRLSQTEYLRLLMETDPSRRPIRKTRYCLTEAGRYYEIDVYPFWSDRAIVEVELADENEAVTLPEMLKVIKEVTEDKNYRNSELAKI